MAGLAITGQGCARNSQNCSKALIGTGNAIFGIRDMVRDFTRVPDGIASRAISESGDAAVPSAGLAAGWRASVALAVLKVDSAEAEGGCSTRAISSSLF